MEYDILEDRPWEKKENWPEGSWTHEDDERQFIYRNYDCVISRNNLGSFSAYIRVPKNHPELANGKIFSFLWIKAHNGVSIEEASEYENDFWIGFECLGHDDIKPVELAMEKYYSEELKEANRQQELLTINPMGFKKTYKDINFMENEVMNVVDQLATKKLIVRNMRKTTNPKSKKDKANGKKDL